MLSSSRPESRRSKKNPHRYDSNNIDSLSSSESCGGGGVSAPSVPLHLQQSCDLDDDGYYSPSHYSANSPLSAKSSDAARVLTTTTTTPTTTIVRARSPRTKQLHEKLNRPRRRGRRTSSVINSNSSSNNNNSQRGISVTTTSFGRSDCSIASENSASEQSFMSRNSTRTRTRSIHGLSRRGGVGGGNSTCSSNSFPGQHSVVPSNSLFGLRGSTYSTTADMSSLTTSTSPTTQQQQGDSDEHYQKYHRHPQHYESMSPLSSPSSSSSLPPLPSLRVIASELSLICSLYCRYAIRSIRTPCKNFRRRLLYGIVTLLIAVLGLTTWLCYNLYADGVDMCTPPTSLRPPPSDFAAFVAFVEHQHSDGIDSIDLINNNNNQKIGIDEDNNLRRPLVEYYIHGRGIGHYARSVAIVEKLNLAGVDVRMFLTRASMWRAMHEDAKIIVDSRDQDMIVTDHYQQQQRGNRLPVMKWGKTTAISITSVTPDQSFFDALSHVIERVSGDCEVSAASGRFPQLVISDGDLPGMIRAEFGGIPSVGIAHGQLFSIAQKPEWIKGSNQLNHAWNKQGRLNSFPGLSDWQIATHYCFFESRFVSGTVARAPLRPEVLQMAEARKWFRRGKVHERIPQPDQIRKLLLSETSERTVAAAAVPQNKSDHATSSSAIISHRNLVISYFRDHNGEHVVQALLDAGLDVLLFDTGYSKEMANNPNRYGVKWIVKDREKERKKYIRTEASSRRRLLQVENITFPSSGHIEASDDGPKLIRVMDRSLFVPLMHVADGVASSAGSQLMSECIYSHMPLLALYTEEDDEQRLNVELSLHIDAPCHRPFVFGNSFESLTYALKSNETLFETHHHRSPVLESLNGFVREVQSSSVSDTYYRNVHLFDDRIEKNDTEEDTFPRYDRNKTEHNLDEEDPFRGLPDAAAIILEILKQVVQKE